MVDPVSTDRRQRRQRARQIKAALATAHRRPVGIRRNDHEPRRQPPPSTASCPTGTSAAAGDGESDSLPSGPNFVDWILHDPSLLWEPFHAGSTILHWAAQHLRYEQINHRAKLPHVWNSGLHPETVVIEDPWEWLLGLASLSATTKTGGIHHTNNRFVQQRDNGGESCLDCFQYGWIHGTWGQPRSAATDPYRFGDHVDTIRQTPYLLAQLQGMVHRNDEASTTGARPAAAGDRRVTIVYKVWMAWKRLCQVAAASGSTTKDRTHSTSRPHHDEPSLMAFMARTGRALDPFAWLAVTLCPEQCSQPNDARECPLHLWASSPRPPTEDLDALGRHLLQVYPQAVQCVDRQGRIPLHRALLRANKPLQSAQDLALACPATLGIPDPVEELYPFAMAASVLRLEVRTVLRATQRRHPSQRLYDWLDTCRRDMDTYEQEVSTTLLGHVYIMLRALPQALEYSRRADAPSITQGEEEAATDGDATHQTVPTSHTSPAPSTTPSVGTTVKEAYAKVLHDLA